MCLGRVQSRGRVQGSVTDLWAGSARVGWRHAVGGDSDQPCSSVSHTAEADVPEITLDYGLLHCVRSLYL